MRNKFLYSLVLAAGITGLSACEDFLDINTDPNNPSEVQSSLLLPSIQVSMSQALDMSTGLSNATGTYMHHFVQRNAGLNDYDITGQNFGVTAPWNILYLSTLTDIRQMITQAEANGNMKYVGVAQLIEAYVYSIMVDMWGDVAYFDSSQGIDNMAPGFDDDASIYQDLFAKIDVAIANLKADSPLAPLSDDLIYGGNMENWERFANSLKLKLYNQIRLDQDVSSQVSAILSSGMYIQNDDQSFELAYGTNSAPDDRNPGFTQEWAPGGSRYYISPYLYEMMKGTNSFFPENILSGIRDPRMPYYWYNQVEPTLPNEEPENDPAYFDLETGFLSIYMFSLNIDPNEGNDQGKSQSIAGLYPVGGKFDDDSGEESNYQGNGNAPLRMFSHYSMLYTRAELALTGVSTEDDAVLFEQAVQASFDKVNSIANNAGEPILTQNQIDNYINRVMSIYEAGDQTARLNLLMTEKWIASFGFPVDSYTDYRRTGFPIIHDGNNDVLSVTIRGREYPVSFPYPTADIELLPNESQRNIYLDKIFWDE